VGNKIQQLVSLGVNFIDKYASDFLLQQGGWVSHLHTIRQLLQEDNYYLLAVLSCSVIHYGEALTIDLQVLIAITY